MLNEYGEVRARGGREGLRLSVPVCLCTTGQMNLRCIPLPPSPVSPVPPALPYSPLTPHTIDALVILLDERWVSWSSRYYMDVTKGEEVCWS
jgi:hypothetical protein